MRKITMFLMFAMATLVGFSQTVQVGSGTSTTSNLPIVSCYGYTYSQQIYLASEIGMAGNIEKVRFYYASGGAPFSNSDNWNLSLGHTTKSAFASSTDWEASAGLTTLFSGTIVPVGGAWFEMTLTTPFAYNGVDNLIIAVDENVASWNCTMQFGSYSAAGNQGIYYRSDSTDPDPAAPPSATGTTSSIAQVQLVFPSSLPPACAANVLPADLATGVALNPTLTWDVEASATSYDVYLSTTSPATLVGNVPTASYTPATNLLPNTLYYYTVVPQNAIGGATGCVEQSFTTGTGFNYCATSYANGGGSDGITDVTLGTLTNTSGGNSSSPYYTFFNALAIPDLGQTTTADVSITFGPDGSQYSAVWIDFNQNGTFEASEGMIASGNAGSNGTMIISIPVPAGAVLGNTRMRVRGGNDSPLTTAQACGASSSTYGETEDYIVNITTPPACLASGGLTSSISSGTTVQLDWDMTMGASAYNYEIRTSGAAGSGMTGLVASGNITDTFILVSTLMPQTMYSAYVQTDCGTSTSIWSASNNFTTPCAAIVAPFLESFTAITAAPTCWTGSSTTGGPWTFTGNPDYTASGVQDNTTGTTQDFTWMDFSSTDVGVILETPIIDVSALTVPELKFFIWSHYSGAGLNTYNEVYVEAYDGSAWQLVHLHQGDLGNAWNELTFDLTSFTYGSNLVRLRFRAESGGDGNDYYNDILLDDVEVREQPPCPNPTALVASNATETTVDLAWTQPGTAAAWNVVYGPAGFDPLLTGTTVAVTSNPATVNGLTCELAYDFYIQADCGVTDGLSTLSSVASATTLLCPCMGTPVPGNAEASLANVCTGSDVNLSLQNAISGGGVTYQWESADDAAFTMNLQMLGTNDTETATVNGDTYYHCVVTCSASGMTGTSANVLVVADPLENGNDMATAKMAMGPYLCSDSAWVDTVNTSVGCWSSAYSGTSAQSSVDAWYTFTLTESTDMLISLCASGFDTYLHLLDGTGAQLASNDDNGPACSGSRSSISMMLAPGTYFAVAQGYSGNTGEIVMRISKNEDCNACSFAMVLDNTVTTTSTTADVTWTPTTFPGTGWYELRYKESAAATWTNGGTVSTSATNKFFSGLTPNTSYDVEGRVLCSASEAGAWSATVTFSTPILQDCALSPVLSASIVQGNFVEVSWPAVTGAGWYAIRYKESSAATWTSGGSASGSATSKIISGLTAGTSYDFEALTYCTNGIPSAWGGLVTVSTTALAGCELPPVLDLVAVGSTFTTITFSWAPVTGAGWYGFQYKESSSSTWIAGGSAGGAATMKTKGGLTQSTSYDFQARTYCPNGAVSAWSATATYFTDGLASVGITSTDKNNPDVDDKSVTEASEITKVYPNPTSDVVNIEFNLENASENTTLRLMDMSGRIVRLVETQSNVGVNTVTMDLQDLTNGIYTLLVYDNNNLIHTSKVKKN